MTEFTYLGRPMKYWAELQQRFEGQSGLEAAELLLEVAELRGKVSFYESRIKQMAEVMK